MNLLGVDVDVDCLALPSAHPVLEGGDVGNVQLLLGSHAASVLLRSFSQPMYIFLRTHFENRFRTVPPALPTNTRDFRTKTLDLDRSCSLAPPPPAPARAGPARGWVEAAAAPERRGAERVLGLVAAERRPHAERPGARREDGSGAVGSLQGHRQAPGAGERGGGGPSQHTGGGVFQCCFTCRIYCGSCCERK